MLKFELRQVFLAVQKCGACPLSNIEGGHLVCGKDGTTVSFFDESYHCPEGKWKNQIVNPTVILQGGTRPPPIESRGVWDSIKGSWSRVAEVAGQVAQFATVVASGQNAPVDVVEARRLSCFGGPDQAPCVNLQKGEDGHSYCGACGCGERPLARLDDGKLEWTYLPCPLARPGFSNEEVATT